MSLKRFSVATFNLFNLQDAGKEMHRGAAWTEEQFEKKGLVDSVAVGDVEPRHRGPAGAVE